MQQLLAVGASFRINGRTELTEGHPVNPALLAWLTEQHDIQERKETVTFWMELEIVVLVAAELFSQLQTLCPLDAPTDPKGSLDII